MHKTRRTIYIYIISLLLLIIMFVTGCPSSKKNPPIVKDIFIHKQGDGLLFPAPVKKDGVKKWGYINSDGTFVISPQFDGANDFQKNDLAIVMIDTKEGLINKKGEIVLKPTFDSIGDFSEGLAIGRIQSQNSIIDEKGVIVLATDYSIGNFTNGFAVISKEIGTKGYSYGYMDKNLKVVVEPTYKYAESFSDNKALVKISDTQYGIMDNNLKMISTLNYKDMRWLSEDIICFKDETTGKFGCVNTIGKIIVKATFEDYVNFKDGLAIVTLVGENYPTKVGVIDKTGEYVIKPTYSSIQYLGNKLFAATKISKDYGSPYYAPKSLIDSNGKQLTDFKYFYMTTVADSTILVTDDTSTYFIGNTGKEISNFPKFTGNGFATITNDLIKANIDQRLSYVTKTGKVVWQESTNTALSNGLSLNSIKYSPNRSLLIYYPEVKGLTNIAIQNNINDRLKKIFMDDNDGKGNQFASKKYDDGSYAESLTIDFQATQNKDLLTILMTGYNMPNGAAHGMPVEQYYNIDIKTGDSYKLSDLFKDNSNYISKLSTIIKAKMEKNIKEEGKVYLSTTFTITPDQGFYLTKDALNIFFTPYEIAPYAGGFPTFSIPYNEIKDIINTEGGFWKSFDKSNIVSNYEATTTGKDSIVGTAIKNYEEGIVNAINANDFTLVEPTLIKDSNLYKSQKSLLSSLNKQGIKEKLTGYSISKIKWNEDETQCKVYVDETISIKYPDKDYIDKKFSYVYTLTYSEGNKLLLSDIGK